jgi:hypoxanthine phosphoribosyltransferase
LAAASFLRAFWFVCPILIISHLWRQRISQRTFLKRPDSHKNVPIYAICLSLYEPVPGVTNEQIGSEVIRTQWLYVTLLATMQQTDLWSDSGPDAGEILVGKRVLIVVRASLLGGTDATLIVYPAIGRGGRHEEDFAVRIVDSPPLLDLLIGLRYAVSELQKDAEDAVQLLPHQEREGAKTKFAVFVVHNKRKSKLGSLPEDIP